MTARDPRTDPTPRNGVPGAGADGNAAQPRPKAPPTALLAAARDVFADRGYAAASMRTIAAAAGVSPGAPYKHVAGKAALYGAVVTAAQDVLLGAFRTAADTAAPGIGRVVAVFAASADLHAADPGLARFLSTVPVETARHPELAAEVAPVGLALAGFVHELARQVADRGEIAATDTEAFRALLLAALTGFAVFGTTVPVATHAAMVDAFGRLLRGGLVSPTPLVNH